MKKIQLQVELHGKKMESEAKATQELETKSSAFQDDERGLKKEVYAKPWVSREGVHGDSSLWCTYG